ncbi:MAG: LuxR C-terminal-related transcriptional regulator [Rhodospirillales bacterium]|nr:LuxR C-terminal-related transcriptional regulator [Rhodospirillales bacterium]
MDDYYPWDEAIPRVRRLPDSQLVHIRDLYSEEDRKTSPAYNEMLPRFGYENSLAVRLDGPPGTRMVWSFADPFGGGDWSSSQIDMIRGLLPHLRQYVGVRQALVDAHALGTSLAGLLDNGRSGIIQLDRRGRIVEANDPARNLLKRNDGLFDRGGYLRAWSPSDDADLHALLERALPRVGAQGIGGSMTVRRPSVSPRLALHISPLGDGHMDFRPSCVAALVLVVDPTRRARIDPGLVSESLGLTPTQGQVAALLAEGKTIREIAVSTGRKESTVRWHLHHACSKHGISRQVELIQLVLSLAAVLRS